VTSATARPLALRLRPDLQVQHARYLGRQQIVVKDPIGLRYFRFAAEEFALLEQLDGQASLAAIRQSFEDRFRPQVISTEAIYRLVCRAHADGLLVSDAPGQGEQLRGRDRTRRAQARREAWQNVLCIRFRGIDPGRFLDVLTRWTGWIFSPPAVAAGLLLMAVALVLVAVQFAAFRDRLPQWDAFWAPQNWGWFALTLAVTKILHELGHAVACKRFGGECHEMGILLLVLTPCLYCDVSDAWTLPSRWQRMAIAAAGIYVELLLAAVCTWVWWFTDPGPFSQFCLAVMGICSLGTLALNANPLMRYDGYYLLSDLVQIPNLRQKSSAAAGSILAWVTGRPAPALDPFLVGRRRWALAAYAAAAAVYRWFVLATILWFLFQLFAPWGLKSVGRLIACLAVYGLLVRPAWQLARSFAAPDGDLPGRLRAGWLVGALGSALVAAAWLVPLPHYVHCPMTIRLREAVPVVVDTPGTLAEICVQPGCRVQAGQQLVTLHNPEAELAVERLSTEQRRLAIRLDNLRQRSLRGDTAASGEMEATAAALASVGQQWETARDDLARLSLVAPRGGTVFLGDDDCQGSDDALPQTFPSAAPLQSSSTGATLTRGTAVCRIGDPRMLSAVLEVDESAADLVRPAAIVRLFPNQTPGCVFHATIGSLSVQTMRVGGASSEPPSAASSDAAPRVEPASQNRVACLATCDFQDPQAQLVIGGRGRAKVLVGYRTVAERLWRWWQT
jgi:putative peptide zinc metalloprotease protein